MEDSFSQTRDRLYKALTAFVFILSLVGIAGFFLAVQWVKVAGNQYAQAQTITVSGSGEIYAVPDIAEITFSVVEEAKTAALAQEKATTKMNAAKEFLLGKEIDEKDINTTNYSIYPKYEYTRIEPVCYSGYCPPGKQEITGYEVNQSVSVKVRATDKAGEILAGLGNISVSNVYGPNFSFEDDTAVKEEARSKAIAEAREQAKRMAKELGVRLGKVVSFNESGNYPYPSPYSFSKDMAVAVEGRGGDTVNQIAPPEVPVGQNKVTSYVTIVYEIK